MHVGASPAAAQHTLIVGGIGRNGLRLNLYHAIEFGAVGVLKVGGDKVITHGSELQLGASHLYR